MKRYVIKHECDLTKSERKALHLLLNNLLTWSTHVKKYLYWSSKPHWRVMVYENNELIGSLSIVRRRFLVADTPLTIAGIGNVGIRQDKQGKGYATELLTYTTEFLRKNRFSLALLFCDEKRTRLYEKASYKRLGSLVTYYSKSQLKKEPIAMILPITIQEEALTAITKQGIHIGRGTW